MNMQDLAGRVQAGHIDALHLVSLEGGIYVLELSLIHISEPTRP